MPGIVQCSFAFRLVVAEGFLRFLVSEVLQASVSFYIPRGMV